ncbi:aromatic acid/H+ symport family MFS transporter [Neobacillus niacini]|uniref:MFS transporter n=1 Tax=Neobacillus niacini TaxID=86668 RepID=UPI003002B998
MEAIIESTKKPSINGGTKLVVLLSWLFMIFEGYDLLVYGTIVPSLLEYKQWDITPTQAGRYGSYVVIGMLVGAIVAGMLADRFGRKKVLISGAALCAIFMMGSALSPTPELFGLSRFITGIGLGTVMPVVTVLTLEYAPSKRRAFTTIIMYSGYQLGGVLAALLAMSLIPSMGWRAMFWIGAIPLLLVVPLAIRFLPESLAYLMAKGRKKEVENIAERFNIPIEVLEKEHREENSTKNGKEMNSITSLLSKSNRKSTILFWLASFCGLFMIFGLGTWLPTIMMQSGYSIGSALSFLLVLNLGTVIGSFLTAAAADRWSHKFACTISFLIAFAAFILLSFNFPSMLLTYILIAAAGMGSIGTQYLINAYVGVYYPATIRTTALGWSLGIGRFGGIVGPIAVGLLVSLSLGTFWHFGLFALTGLIGAIVVFSISSSTKGQSLDSSSSQEVQSIH